MNFKIWHLPFLIVILILIIKCTDSATQATESTPEAEVEAPAPISPEINSEQNTTVTLRWGSIENAQSYKISLSKNKNFTNTLLDSVVDSTTVRLENLPQDTTLYWRVNAHSQGRNSQWSKPWHFGTHNKLALELGTPTQVSPADEKEDAALKPHFKWEPVGGAEAYELDVSHGDEMVINKEIDGNKFTPSKKLATDESYFWRIRAVVGDTTGEWSEIHSFVTVDKATELLAAPNQTAPENNAEKVSLTPTFEWKAVDGAKSYTIQIDQGDKEVVSEQVEKPTFTSGEELKEEIEYSWKVKASNAETDGRWSEVHNFTAKSTAQTTVVQLAATSLVAPTDEAEGVALKPTFEWKAVDGADAYELDVSHGDEMVIQQKVDKATFTTDKTFSAEETYYWRVRAISGDTNGKWTETHSFTTQKTDDTVQKLSAPNQTAPENNAEEVSLTPTFEWKAVDGAKSYTIQVNQGDSEVVSEQVEKTDFTLSDKLKEKTEYTWKVKASNAETDGKWSESYSFTTKNVADKKLAAPTLVAPSNEKEEVALKPDFKWKALDGADEYELDVSHGNDMVIQKKVDKASFAPGDAFTAEETYYWRVRAFDGETGGEWSEIQSFTTKASSGSGGSGGTGSTVGAVTLTSPSDGASGLSTSVSLEWQSITGINQYRVQVAAGSGFASPVTDETTDGNSYQTSGLNNDQRYYWRVQAAGDGNSSNWSTARSFRTEAVVNDGGGSDADVVSERQALMDLYNATGGDRWNNNSGWGQGAPSNSWHGIQVNSQGHVTRIDLFKNGLSGKLPNSLGSLKSVRYLNLKNNRLTGPIPPSIGDMESLQYLIMSGRTYEIGGTLKEPPENLNYAYHAGKHSSSTNRFSGTIPGHIGNLHNLLFLEISDQPDITGPIPSELGNLTKLRGLYLNSDDFDGYSIPESIGNLTELRHLYFSSSDVTGELPKSLKNLTKLTYINIVSTSTRGKGLTGALPDFSNFTNLRSLVLSENQMTGEFPAYFNNGNFTHLHTLRITWNQLTGTLHGFDKMPAMESLGLEGNNLTGDIGHMLTQLPDRLQIMGLGWNNFTGELPSSGWPDFWQMKTLYLNDNNFTGTIPCDFWQKIDNPRLGITWLKNNNFTANCTSSMSSVTGNVTGGTANLDIDVSGNNF